MLLISKKIFPALFCTGLLSRCIRWSQKKMVIIKKVNNNNNKTPDIYQGSDVSCRILGVAEKLLLTMATATNMSICQFSSQ